MGILDIVRRRKIVSPAPAPAPEAEFWRWFAANEAMVWEYRRHVRKAFSAVLVRLWRVNSALAFDIGPLCMDGRRELVITANGIAENFGTVHRLVAAAPLLPRWKVVAFRPRRDLRECEVRLTRGDRVPLDEVRFTAETMGSKVRIQLFVPGCGRTPGDEFQAISRFIVDLAVGEFDAEMHVAAVTAVPPQPEVETRPLAELPAVIDALPKD
jgi:hypothetical protein